MSTESGPDHSLLYDELNRLVEVRDPSNGFATVATFSYDVFGRRVKKEAAAKVTLYFYDSDGRLIQEVEKRDGADYARAYVFLEDELVAIVDRVKEVGTTSVASWLGRSTRTASGPPAIALLVFVGAGSLLLVVVLRRYPAAVTATTLVVSVLFLCAGTRRPPPAFRWVHVDPLGTPLAITNTPADPVDVAVVWRADYEPFGSATVDGDPDGDGATLTFNVRFPGQYEDVETGWHYNFARTYDPSTGRYLEADPIGVAGGLNLYGYAGGDPMNNTDPRGQQPAPTGIAVPAVAVRGAAALPIAPLAGALPLPIPFPNIPAPPPILWGIPAFGFGYWVGGKWVEPYVSPYIWPWLERLADECGDGPDCDLAECLEACERDVAGREDYCRSLTNPAVAAICWAHVFQSVTACQGWCYWHCE